MTETINQTNQIKKYLEMGYSITPLEALKKFGCLRLSARIYDLRHYHNLRIVMQLVRKGKKQFAQYSIQGK